MWLQCILHVCTNYVHVHVCLLYIHTCMGTGFDIQSYSVHNICDIHTCDVIHACTYDLFGICW